MTPAVTALELRVIEDVLGMGNGYVLDFSDREFATFFEDFGVDIGDDRYCADGLSKAKRLRRFLRGAAPSLVGQVLKGLWEHRLVSDSAVVGDALRDEYQRIVEGLLAPPGQKNDGESDGEGIVALPLELFDQLRIADELRESIRARAAEAQSCFRVRAYLSVVILCGSILEGLCLAVGMRDPQRVSRAFSARFKKHAPSAIEDLNLFEWLAVLGQLGEISPTVEKYGHALRDFRNYVHPQRQIRSGFTPDEHNARIALQVVLAAVTDLNRKATKATGNG